MQLSITLISIVLNYVCYAYSEIRDPFLQSDLKIASWNVQRLGRSKMAKPDIVTMFIQVMMQFDIIVLEEVTDSTGEAQRSLLEKLNEAVGDSSKNFSMVESERIGATSYKEQYVFYYRKALVSVIDSFKYPDDEEGFQIEPFVVVFEAPNFTTDKFAIVSIHTSPSRAPEEIDALVDVYEAVQARNGSIDTIITGDFNAGCSYVSERQWDSIRLRTQSRFLWKIDDRTDTTTKASLCPYDRIVVAGETLKNSIIKNSAKPFYFDAIFNLTDKKFVYDVSDHYPVEISLRGKHNLNVELQLGLGVQVETNEEAIRTLKEDSSGAGVQVFFEQMASFDQSVTASNEILYIEFDKAPLSTVISKLETLVTEHPSIFKEEVLLAFNYNLGKHLSELNSLFQISALCLPSSTCSIMLHTFTSVN